MIIGLQLCKVNLLKPCFSKQSAISAYPITHKRVAEFGGIIVKQTKGGIMDPNTCFIVEFMVTRLHVFYLTK